MHCLPEEAANETIFLNIGSFFPGATFIVIFQEEISVHQNNTNFPGSLILSANK